MNYFSRQNILKLIANFLSTKKKKLDVFIIVFLQIKFSCLDKYFESKTENISECNYNLFFQNDFRFIGKQKKSA